MCAHFPERPFPGDPRSRLILARNPNGKAILFVHGYGGNAVKTWTRFESLLPSDKQCAGSDLIFYGYDGLWADSVASASIFGEFLESLFANAPQLINPALPAPARRSEDFRYSEIVIVAHSLGAVISRWALSTAHQQIKPWVTNTRLVLFAPAHRGANVAKLAVEAVTGIRCMQVLASFARFKSPLVDQLAPNSDYLRELQDRVNRLVGIDANHCLLARAVFIAEHEHVVQNLPFSHDPDPIPIQNSDHFSICKPKSASDRNVLRLLPFL
jgi:pimeloyl-ACP methyl ester carboxylesterase